MRAIAAQPNTLVGIRNRALLSIGYDFLARRSEISSLQDADIEFLPDNAIRGIIRKSKTDQFGRSRLTFGSNQQPLSGHSFRVGAALYLLEQGEPLERIMLRGGWQTDSTAMKYLRNWAP